MLLLELAIFAFVHLNELAQANFYMWSVTVVSNLNTQYSSRSTSL